MRLREIMSTNVQAINPTESLERAKLQMQLRGIHHLVVIDGLQVVGIVTSEALEKGIAEGVARVEDVMSRHAFTGTPGMTVRKAANLLRGRTLGALPVVDRQRLVGIVTVSDLLELLGRGAERPVAKSRRWTLRDRGAKHRRRSPILERSR